MSSENDEPQKKKLFEFNAPDVGIRSVNLLNNLNVIIPTSKWEITPRTATQSKRLKWDQTPFGVVKVESEIYKDNKLQSTSGFSLKQKQNDFMFNKRLTMDEINTILPKEGYLIFNVWNNEEIEQIDFQLFDEEEKLFFSELNETTDEDIKLIFKGLYILKKVKKNRVKRVIKTFLKVKNRNYALEKVILFCFSFDLSINEKSLILQIINILLSESLSIFRREVFYILAKFSEEENLVDECKESFMTIFKNNFEDFKTALEREIKDCEKETKDLISRLLEMGMYVFGLSKNLNWLKSFCVYGKSKEKMIILYSLILIIRKLGNSLEIFANDLLDFIELIVKDCQNYIKTTSGYLINLMIEKCILDKDFEIFERLLKIMSNMLRIGPLFDLFIDDQQNNINNIKLPQEKWVFIWVKALSFISVNCPKSSRFTFALLQKCKLEDENIFKILNNLILDIKEIETFAINHLESCFKEYNKKSLISFIKRLGNSVIIRDKLISLILDSERTNLTLEIISESKNIFYLNDSFFDNFYVALKNTKITNRRFLKWIFGNTQNISEFKDLFLRQINQENKKIFGFIYCAEIVDFLDNDALLYLGNIIWEKIENLESDDLIESLNLLNKIYKRKRFQSFDEIIYLCSTKLKKGDKKAKRMIFKFLTNVIKSNLNQATNFNRLEFIRICFEASDCLTEVGEKSRKVIIDFVKTVGQFVNLQDLVDIFLIKLYESENYKGLIEVLAEISNEYGLFYVLPKIMIKYEATSYSIRLRICKFLIEFIKMKNLIEEKYFATVITLIEDLILDKELEMRKSALRLISVLVNTLTPPTIHTDVIIHLLNLSWFCVLDEIEFDECWECFIKTLGPDVLMKYLQQGLYHPNKKIRSKYEHLYQKLIFN